MEPSLGLLHGGGSGTCDQSSKDYMGMQNESELELGLGLSLGGGATAVEKGSAWGRILTAKDFPNGFCCGTKRERSASDEGSASAAAAVSSQVVGWPPIRAYRMNTLFNQSKNSNVGEDNKVVGGNETNENSKKKHNHGNNNNDNNNDKNINVESCVKERVCPGFVKVNMDGLPIGRKVDLHAHKNYESLANALQEMFFSPLSIRGGKEKPVQPPKLLDGSSEFVLTYEDKEGDWMLVGDVPWGMFLSTVKRLRIMRTSDANGLAPKIQEKNEKQKSKLI